MVCRVTDKNTNQMTRNITIGWYSYIITPGVGLDFEFHHFESLRLWWSNEQTNPPGSEWIKGNSVHQTEQILKKKTLIESTNTPNDYLSHVGDRGSYSKSKVLQNGGFSDVATQKTETCHITYSTITHQRVSLKHQTHAKKCLSVYHKIYHMTKRESSTHGKYLRHTPWRIHLSAAFLFGAPWIPSTKNPTQC
jgi:hypothetical protein